MIDLSLVAVKMGETEKFDHCSNIKEEQTKGNWTFNNISMAIIMNVAVGGGWPQYDPNLSTYPQEMVVEYVKVYKI